MTRALPSLGLLVVAASALSSAPASAESKTYGDISLGAGFGTNPLLQTSGRSSPYLNASAFIGQLWRTERSSTRITGLVSNSTYARDYGSKQVFSLNAATSYAVSPMVTVNAGAEFSADFAGQLDNRFTLAPDDGSPPPAFPPPDVDLPDYVVSSGRQYRISGNLGASIKASARDTVSLSSRVQNTRFSGDDDRGFTSFSGTAGYFRQLSDERQIGGSLTAQHISYEGGGRSNILNPAINFSTRFSQRFSATLGAGVLLIDQRTPGVRSRPVSPSFSATVCGEGEYDRYCASAARDTQAPSSLSLIDGDKGSAVSTRASVNYSRRIGERQTLQASFSGSRRSGSGSGGGKSTYLTALAGYERGFGLRLSTGINLSARKIVQPGDDPKTDFSALLLLRYRIGDLL